jgi:adenine-specific DNA-methyltransferase
MLHCSRRINGAPPFWSHALLTSQSRRFRAPRRRLAAGSLVPVMGLQLRGNANPDLRYSFAAATTLCRSQPSTEELECAVLGERMSTLTAGPPHAETLDDARAQYALLSKDELIALLLERRPEGINLVFAGKAGARRLARRVRPRAQTIVSDLCVGGDVEQANNLILEGENLQAMVSLYKYHDAVDLVVADPPYNTGNDFRYNDRWDDDPNDTEPGDLVSPDDGGRYTKWMKFMLPRLQMMHTLLKPSGVLAICIDHREVFRLGLLLNEVFGESNRLGIINWQKTYAPKATKHLSSATEYVLIYAKDVDRSKTSLLPRDAGMDRRYSNPDGDPGQAWTGDNCIAPQSRSTTIFAIQSPFSGRLHYPEGAHVDGARVAPPSHHWRLSRREMKEQLEKWGSRYEERDLGDRRGPALVLAKSGASLRNYNPDEDDAVSRASRKATSLLSKPWPQLFFLEADGRQGFGRPRMKRYLQNVLRGKIPWTYWAEDDYSEPFVLGSQSWDRTQSGHSQTGLQELDQIVGRGHGFETVKPLRLIQKVIQLWCPPNGLVLDPFAGSGTTAHAVLDLNANAGASRSFVLIEQGRAERDDRFARTLTAERVKRVVSGKWAEGSQPAMGGGFRFARLTKKVDARAVLAMERDELIDLLISSHWDRDTRARPCILTFTRGKYRHLIARDPEGLGYFLLWQGAAGERGTTLDAKTYREIVSDANEAGVRAPYNVYARYEDFQASDVRFFKIPDRILAHLGVSESRDAFNDGD